MAAASHAELVTRSTSDFVTARRHTKVARLAWARASTPAAVTAETVQLMVLGLVGVHGALAPNGAAPVRENDGDTVTLLTRVGVVKSAREAILREATGALNRKRVTTLTVMCTENGPSGAPSQSVM